MEISNPSATSPKYEQFKILETTYKTVHDHPINVYILIPRAHATAAPSPIIVKWHGGFLLTGDALFADWYPQWQIDYAIQHNAVVVLPNYRLLPEAKGVEIMADVHDFWAWLARDFPGHLAGHKVEVDLSKVLVSGESAGGYLSIQSALEKDSAWRAASSRVQIKASIATYPVLDIKSRYYSEAFEKSMMGAPMVPKEVLADHMHGLQEDAAAGNKRVVTSAIPPDRMMIALSVTQQGLYAKYMGEDESILYPLERIESVKPQEVPPILILHGREDTAVPVEGSEKWVEKAKVKFGDGKVVLVVQPGQHGFDVDPAVTLSTPWLKDELATITDAWLGKD